VKIFGWQADFAGCAWYRILLPLAALREQGEHTRFGNTLKEEFWDYDVVIAQRTCLEGPTGIFQRMARSKGNRPKLVYEVDDDLLNLDQHNPSVEFFNNPQIQANIIANLQVADVVTVSTAPLAERLAQYNRNIHVVPNCIPAALLDWQHGYHVDRITVGWQGSATHTGDWARAANPIGRWFNQARQQGVPVEFHTVGSTPPSFPSVHPHRRTDWVGHDRFYHLLDWHFAVAPLAPTVFNTSKSDLRCLEANALGFPVVASDVVAYRESVQHGKTGFLVSDPKQWDKHLWTLTKSPQLRDEMAQAGREWAATRTVEGNAWRWLKAYQS
jgi:glycosyltransferase involved in cell wall biosynthesis